MSFDLINENDNIQIARNSVHYNNSTIKATMQKSAIYYNASEQFQISIKYYVTPALLQVGIFLINRSKICLISSQQNIPD